MAKPRGRKLIQQQQKDQFDPSSKESKSTISTRDYEEYKDEQTDGSPADPQMFFGVLDREELEYFKQIESTLALDAFESPEEKSHMVSNVLQEAKGKELKLVTSQICSKLMERVILESDDAQLKSIFKTFNGFFYNLSCHKYASHVLETLFVRSAALVEKELVTPSFDDNQDDSGEYGSMENMFLFMINELKPHFKEMICNQYASHSFRLLLLILSSKTLPSSTKNNSILRSRRSKIARKMIDIKDNEDFNKVYQTPGSFKAELGQILSSLYKDYTNNAPSRKEINPSVRTSFRELCIDKVASSVIQLLIQIEGIFDRDRSFWRLIFNTDDKADPKEESFIEYLLSDAVGSHFFETVIGLGKTKYVERLYNIYIKERIGKLAKRDATGAFVVQALLKTLKPKEVKEILDIIVPELSMLLNSNMDFGTAIIDASNKNGHYLKEEIIEQLVKKFYSKDSENRNILESCLMLSSSTLGNTKDDWPTSEERRRSLFLEELIIYDDKFLDITVDSMLALPAERLLQMCYHGVFSHVVESILVTKKVEIIKRKLLLNVLCKDVVNMSCNAYGSHVMDKLWEFTAKLALYKERIANALVAESEKVKNSTYGRQVWKNWSLELFVRRRFDWKSIVREQDEELFPNSKPLQPTPKGNGFKGNNNRNNFNKRPYENNRENDSSYKRSRK
ncbi:hypothetical protein TPHA_0N01000 [Tetrapisispora phaffii CBS 4417]|uniref:Nucleolar protein 9 n=1 Tax=Tetrapisispora phaffii (strain ATCC 24235 / CBS 4417 / NBRC 1672 / NRRL Y-8282 / UCD 70-5) TaxID=1071381 RepID=G8C153_TETPH|nr:hypothetical protein TPHA_0N01000 [Tetrapisispora phaffii CBS 4417]CCE65881.1 hypothetical protein TPHA_0N01000 [Tetrapisispora phaffii CBS 4417]